LVNRPIELSFHWFIDIAYMLLYEELPVTLSFTCPFCLLKEKLRR